MREKFNLDKVVQETYNLYEESLGNNFMLEALLVKYNSIMIMKTNYWYDAVLL